MLTGRHAGPFLFYRFRASVSPEARPVDQASVYWVLTVVKNSAA